MRIQDPLEIDLEKAEVERYARHLALPEIGLIGQKRMKSGSILCIGTGGLGSPLLLYLAAVGIGRIGIVDFDVVESSNLQRQVIHGTSWINKSKIKSARHRILEINPFCKVITFEEELTEKNALQIINSFDVVCDCSDNFPTRYLVNDACVILGKPNVYGSIERFQGQATVFNLDSSSPNYRDLVPIPPPNEKISTCNNSGVIGVLPGIIGTIQATESIKIITGVGETLSGRLLVLDALKMTFKELKLVQTKYGLSINKLINYKQFCAQGQKEKSKEEINNLDTISPQKFKRAYEQKKEAISLIDVRTKNEFESLSIPGSESIPLSELNKVDSLSRIRFLSKNKDLYLICKSGSRSQQALSILSKYKIKGKNIAGGIDAWFKNFP